MSDLKNLLNDFQIHVLSDDKKIIDAIIGDAEHRSSRLLVYQEAYELRLLEIMGKEFPKLKEHVGEDFFEKMAKGYIQQYPSHNFSIRQFGDNFAEFLRSYTIKGPLYAALAELEAAMSAAIDAADAPQISVADCTQLTAEDWELISFSIHPSVKLLVLDYDVISLWHEPNSQQKFKKSKQAYFCLVWRWQQMAYFLALDSFGKQMFEMIQNELPFGQICAELTQFYSGSAEDLTLIAAQNLRNWLEQGVFSSYRL